MTLIFLALAVLSAFATFNLFYPMTWHKVAASVSFIFGLVTGELLLWQILLQISIASTFIWGGYYKDLPGLLALLILICSWFALLCHFATLKTNKIQLKQALDEGFKTNEKLIIDPEAPSNTASKPPYKKVLLPFSRIKSAKVELLKNIQFHRASGIDLKLDIRRPREFSNTLNSNDRRPAPVVLQIHGGAWTRRMGSKKEQALPLMNYLCERGWLCVSISYRLSPLATFPDHIVDCKRALVWVKQNIAKYGGNPDFVIVTGGSAGGHLSALLSLTANLPAFQPGFEKEDTSVQGCVSFYGIYDFIDSLSLQPHKAIEDMLAHSVLKAKKHENPELYRLASPLNHIHKNAPPFMLIHGDKDSLVDVKATQRFARELRQVSRHPVIYAEISGAQHAFDLLPSPRTELSVVAVEQFLLRIHSRHEQSSS